VRFDVLKRLGHFVTESSEHFSEYTSWYIKDRTRGPVDQLNIPLDEYIRRCEVQIAEWHALRKELEGDKPIEVCRSNEYAAGHHSRRGHWKPGADLWQCSEQRLDRESARRNASSRSHAMSTETEFSRSGSANPVTARRRHAAQHFRAAVDRRGGS
jgi:hypothetical protein